MKVLISTFAMAIALAVTGPCIRRRPGSTITNERKTARKPARCGMNRRS